MNTAINQLLNFAVNNKMIKPEDVDYSANLLLDLLKLEKFEYEKTDPADLYDILDRILEYSVEKGLCEDTTTSKDLLDTRIMNTIMPRPSEVIDTFWKNYEKSPKEATDAYYDLSIHSNYIRKSRTDKNIKWESEYKYGPIQISINLSKPEKDPKEIAAAKNVVSSGYPKCLLCKENVGYAGNASHPARQNHRIIPLNLKNGKYYLQYSPYVYYNEHCIILNENHEPMHIDKEAFENLFSFVEQFDHYMAGSNTDIPIVGGSILSHDHYQGGRHHFPMEDAKVLEEININGIKAQILYWPLSTIRLIDKDPKKLVDLASFLLDDWKKYENKDLEIIPYTGTTRHNAITPIVRKKDGSFQIDLVLRNNRTSEKYPDGIFHPHPEHHHIKKENIGLIEVMGLAILPARLKDEVELIKKVLKDEISLESEPSLEKHKEWVGELKKRADLENLDRFMQEEIAKKFVSVLENAGVFKLDEKGIAAFKQYLEHVKENYESKNR